MASAVTVTFSDGMVSASKATSKVSANFALIGRLDGGEYRVISIHAKRELAKPEDVANSRLTDIRIASRV